MTTKAFVKPSHLRGEIRAPFSKSDSHRALIAAALCETPTEIELSIASDDITATKRCLEALGAKLTQISETRFLMEPVFSRGIKNSSLLDCGESGTTLRLLFPVAAALGANPSFAGSGRLPERPMEELISVVEKNGCKLSEHTLPYSLSGKLTGGDYELPGNVSSQYISGLLLALPLLDGDSTITLSTKLESAAYVAMTMKTLETFGIAVSKTQSGYHVKGNQRYVSPRKIAVEGDWSNAAFFLAAGALGSTVKVTGLGAGSLQGDKAICDILRRFGADVTEKNSAVTVKAQKLRGIDINVSEIPDLFPILAVVAAGAEGTTRLFDASRLRIKESDRISAVAQMLKNIGATVQETPDSLIIKGGERLAGGAVDSHNDHRIVMSAAVASIICENEVTIDGAQAVNKSYPHFFSDFGALGGNANVIDNG